MKSASLKCALRERRAEAGLSQEALSVAAGVSRQAIVAVEAGRRVPSTLLALRLSRALRCSVEDLFSLSEGPALDVRLEDPTVRRVALGRVDGMWAAHPLALDGMSADGVVVRALDGRASVEPLASLGTLERNVLVAGCAPLIGVLAGRLERSYADVRGTWVAANSGRALELLEAGLVHVAGLHLVETGTPEGHAPLVRARFPKRSMSVIHLACWRQGLAVAPGNPLAVAGVVDLLRPDLRVAAREDGSGAQQMLTRLLGDDAPAFAPSTRASGHVEAARLVQWGLADVAVTIESAAIAHGLTFLPLSEERFDLVVPNARLNIPHVARLLETMGRRPFRTEAQRLAGYDVSRSGELSQVGA